MPFAKFSAISLALTQLELILKTKFGSRIQIETHYLNMDFAQYVGDLAIYDHPYSSYGTTRASDWFFRQLAFPGIPDNTDEYLHKYYPDNNTETRKIRKFLAEGRRDLGRVLNGYIDKYNLLDADIVGFTIFFSEACSSFAMARLLKERKPEITTIVGGASCEGETAQVYAEQVKAMDYVFSGPALVSLPRFIEHRLSGKPTQCNHINGVLSKTNKAFWHTPKNCCEETPASETGMISTTGDELDINTNLILDYNGFLDKFEEKFPDGKINPILIFETSRGCKWGEHQQCTFCGMSGMMTRYRTLTADNALIQFKSLYKYVPRARHFVASDNMLPENYAKEVFPFLEPPAAKIEIKYQSRPTIPAKDMDTLCRAGITRIQPGIEALSTSTLKLMRKGTTAFRNIQFLKDSSRHPLTLDWNILIYSPGEEETVYEKYLHDIPLLYHLPPPKTFFPIMFVKFSDYFEHAKEYGLDLHPQDCYAMIFPFETSDIRRLAYRFVDNNSNDIRMNEWIDRLNTAVSRWHARWINSDGKVQSRLCLLPNVPTPTIYDSRSGDVIEYTISETAKLILDQLERPADRDTLVKNFSNIQASGVDMEIEFLRGKGLLFEENGRYLSLIAG